MGPYYSGRSRQIDTFTTTGMVFSFNDADIMLCVPGFVDPELVDACGTTRLHNTDEELTARTRVLSKLRTMEKKIEYAIRYVDNRAAKFYDHVKSPDPGQWNRVDLQTAAGFYKRPDNLYSPLAIKIAVHKHLMDHPRKFVAHPTAYRETQTFLVRPSTQAQNILEITNWMRIEEGRTLNEFCDKVKVAMEQAEALRQQSASTEPHEIPTSYNYTLTDTDRKILRFLLDAFHIRRFTQSDPYALPTNHILKRLGLMDNVEWPVDPLTGLQRVLTDLGIFSPWTDSACFASCIESLAYQPIIKPLRAPPYPPKSLGPEDFYASDPLEALRHDFGDMPVYVIDDPSASELDDGLSIETISSEPDNYWVHVHIADPTTLLPPTHTLAYKARAMSESSYLAHGTRCMLPPSTFERFSLRHATTTQQPREVVTFSFKVDTTGDIVDYKVRAALVKNVHITTYDAVDAALGLPNFGRTFPFERPNLFPPSHPPINPDHVERLKLLYNVSSRLVTKRALYPAFSFFSPNAEIQFTHSVSPHLPSPFTETDISTMRRFKLYGGFPDMSYSVTHNKGPTGGSRSMVSEFMKGASRVASRFGIETRTPLVRRHGLGPSGPDPAGIESLIASRDEFGMVDQFEVSKAMVILPRAVHTLAPKGHWAMGVPDGEGYVRVSSPLRRYADLVSHWQIKQALLANSDPARYPKSKSFVFGDEWLLQYAREITLRDRELKKAQNLSNEHWTGIFIKRWLNGEINSETLDPKTAVFEARPGPIVVKEDYSRRYKMRSLVPHLGVWGEITMDKPLEVGERVNVRIAGVKMGGRPKISLEPV